MSEEQIKQTREPDKDDLSIAQAMKQVYGRMDIPDGEAAWQAMQTKLRRARESRRRWRSLRIGMAIAACSIIIGLSFGSLSPTSAFMNWFTMIRKSENGMVNVFFRSTKQEDTNGAKTPPPPEYSPGENGAIPGASGVQTTQGGAIHPEKVTLEQAKKKLDYALQVPASLPVGYSLDRVEIYQDPDGLYRLADITYLNGSGQMLDISQRKLREGSGANTTINQAAGTIKDVDVNGYKANLVLYSAGGSRMEWLVQDVKVEIYGKVGEEEMLTLAKSMK
jgi:hypothetical protein